MKFNIEKAIEILKQHFKSRCFQENKVWVEGPDNAGRFSLMTMAGSTFYNGSLYDPQPSGIAINPQDIDLEDENEKIDTKFEELLTQAVLLNGRRKQRIIQKSDVEELRALVAEHESNFNIKTIRVYPKYAFVSRSYKYRADVTCIEARRDFVTDKFELYAMTVDAHRPNAEGAKTTINGRAS